MKFRYSEYNPSRKTLEELLRQCHDLLIAPVAAHLEERVIIIPDSQLFALPFAALHDGTSHLVERHTISVAPSIGILIELSRAARARDKTAAVVGDPAFAAGGALIQLPGARAEAAEVQTALEGAGYECATMRGDAATKAAVVDAVSRAAIVHLATHGCPDGLFLAGDSEEPSLSTVDVYGLKMSAELAMLSACDTFKGELRTDGVVGIARAFLAAGAGSLGVSLWQVDDGATKELMTQFYSRYVAGGGAAEAMRGAMCAMIGADRWKRPKQWAAFVIYGLPG